MARPEITGRKLPNAAADFLSTPVKLADDVLRGCAAIAAFVGLNERDCWDKLKKGYLPAVKEGAMWVSTRSRLRKHYNEDRYTPPPRDDGDSKPDAPPPRRKVGRPRGVIKRRLHPSGSARKTNARLAEGGGNA